MSKSAKNRRHKTESTNDQKKPTRIIAKKHQTNEIHNSTLLSPFCECHFSGLYKNGKEKTHSKTVGLFVFLHRYSLLLIIIPSAKECRKGTQLHCGRSWGLHLSASHSHARRWRRLVVVDLLPGCARRHRLVVVGFGRIQARNTRFSSPIGLLWHFLGNHL